jgi:hypothetical protein
MRMKFIDAVIQRGMWNTRRAPPRAAGVMIV